MSDFLETLYMLAAENLRPTFISDPEYLHFKEEFARLEDEIAADLGPDGEKRLEALMAAECGKDHFWQLSMFRRALALGIELGRLPAALTV